MRGSLANAQQGPPRTGPRPNRPRLAADMPPIDFSTLVGPLRSLQVVIERWDELAAALSPGGLMPPRILPLSSAAPGYGDAVLRVAVVAHRPSLGPALVSGLRNRLRNARITGVTVDLGYYLSLVATRRTADAGSDTADRWSVAWNSEHVNDLRCPMAVRVPDSALGAAFVSRWPPVRKILMLDTGDEGAAQQKGFSLSWSGDEAPCDYSGHGTSTGSLMRMVASGAATHCFRVLQHGERVVHSGVHRGCLRRTQNRSGGHPEPPGAGERSPVRQFLCDRTDHGRNRGHIRRRGRSRAKRAGRPTIEACAKRW